MIAMMAGYAAAILGVTARRSSVAPTTLAVGAGIGLTVALTMYAMMPLGNLPHLADRAAATGYAIALLLVPVGGFGTAGLLASRWARHGPHSASAEPNRVREGILSGLCAGGTAAVLLSVLTISTMLIFPTHVDLKWANPDPDVPHGTPYEVRMSVGDSAGKYLFDLLLGPLIGLGLGAIGGLALSEGITRRREKAEGPEAPPTKTDRSVCNA